MAQKLIDGPGLHLPLALSKPRPALCSERMGLLSLRSVTGLVSTVDDCRRQCGTPVHQVGG